MVCSDETRGYILFNGDQELFCLIDFLDDVSFLQDSHYTFGSCLEDQIFNAVAWRSVPHWQEFRIPQTLLNIEWEKDGPDQNDVRDLWLDAQPEELKVYWECNCMLDLMCWENPDQTWDTSIAAFYVAKLFRHGICSKPWKELMDKCEYGRKPIDPPTGYHWREPHFSLDRWRMKKRGYKDVPLDEVPEFQFG